MKVVETPVNFSTKHPIVDAEISNDIVSIINGVKKWNYPNGEMCVAGFFVDNKITQVMLMNNSKLPKFRNQINEILSTMNGKQLHALNTKMETGSFEKLLSTSPAFNEIKPFNGMGTDKEYFFGYLVKNGMSPHMMDIVGFEDPLGGDSKNVMEYWRAGLKGDLSKFEDVRRHNVGCLIKEAKILQNNDFLKKEHRHLLDGNGWLIRGISLPSLK